MLKIKIQSSTLIEVIVAMVILTLFIGMFFSFISKNNSKISVEQRVTANLYIQTIINETIADSSFSDNDYKYESIIIKKRIGDFKTKHVYLIKVSAHQLNDSLISEKNIFVEK
jgi:hypothetical protein